MTKTNPTTASQALLSGHQPASSLSTREALEAGTLAGWGVAPWTPLDAHRTRTCLRTSADRFGVALTCSPLAGCLIRQGPCPWNRAGASGLLATMANPARVGCAEADVSFTNTREALEPGAGQ